MRGTIPNLTRGPVHLSSRGPRTKEEEDFAEHANCRAAEFDGARGFRYSDEDGLGRIPLADKVPVREIERRRQKN